MSWGQAGAGEKWLFKVDQTGAIRISVGGGYIIGSTSVIDNAWHHVAAVLYDDGMPDAEEIKLYVDGTEEDISDYSSYQINTSSAANVCIGAFSGDGYFTGRIDDVRIYNRALRAEEIQELYQARDTSNS